MRRRVPTLVLLLAALAAMLSFDAADDSEPTGDAGVVSGAGGFGLPVSPPAGVLSSTWYCAGGTAEGSADDGFADHVVVVSNPTDEPVAGTITVYPGSIREGVTADAAAETTTTTAEEEADGQAGEGADALPDPETTGLEIPARDRTEIRLADVIEAPLASAIVELPGGDAAVEHRVTGRHGTDSAPCASDAASEWYFAWGATSADAREVLVFFNPFPDDAVIDGVYATDDGPREPTRFDGLVVPARSVVGIELGDDVTIRQEIASSLRARTGRVVVDRIQRFDGSEGARGLTVRLGTSVPAEVWMFPDGLIDDGITERYVVFNPGSETAQVEIEIVLDDPGENGFVEPFELTLAPGGYEVVDVGADERVPAGVGHSGIVRSLNGTPVVAERVLVAGGDAERSGISVTTGSPVAGPVWLFADGATTATTDEWLYLYNPSNEFLATVSVTALAGGQPLAIEGLQDLELGPASRLAVRLGSQIERDELALVVTSTLAIVAERGRYAAEGPGVSNAIGIPVADGLETPPPFIEDDGGG